jgi:hypothetical protein
LPAVTSSHSLLRTASEATSLVPLATVLALVTALVTLALVASLSTELLVAAAIAIVAFAHPLRALAELLMMVSALVSTSTALLLVSSVSVALVTLELAAVAKITLSLLGWVLEFLWPSPGVLRNGIDFIVSRVILRLSHTLAALRLVLTIRLASVTHEVLVVTPAEVTLVLALEAEAALLASVKALMRVSLGCLELVLFVVLAVHGLSPHILAWKHNVRLSRTLCETVLTHILLAMAKLRWSHSG